MNTESLVKFVANSLPEGVHVSIEVAHSMQGPCMQVSLSFDLEGASDPREIMKEIYKKVLPPATLKGIEKYNNLLSVIEAIKEDL